MADLTYKELSDAISIQSLKDPQFRKELIADPAGTFAKYSGQPVNSKVFVHENSPKELHFVLPPAINKDELSDEDLEKVSGGEFFIGMAVITAIGIGVGAAGTAAGIANDQTRARHGW
jgi:hypothetical protein